MQQTQRQHPYDDEFMYLREQMSRYADVLVLVEGKKDVASLSLLGFTNLCTVQGKKRYAVIEGITAHDVCILTDFDREGELLHKELNHLLSQRGVRVHTCLREAFRRTNVSTVEGLWTFLKDKI
ncbi:MAG: toprim domain-containing protein [archaeon]